MFYPEQAVACFRVKLYRQGAMFQEYFPFKNHGGEEGALVAAKRYWKEVRDSFPKLSRKQSAQVERRKSRSGVIGVTRVTQKRKGFEYDFWRATWTDRRCARRTRVFSINKYGETEARKKAEAARLKGLDDFPDETPNKSLQATAAVPASCD
jgi:hypothetical protein